jgi:hypothetical protein
VRGRVYAYRVLWGNLNTNRPLEKQNLDGRIKAKGILR